MMTFWALTQPACRNEEEVLMGAACMGECYAPDGENTHSYVYSTPRLTFLPVLQFGVTQRHSTALFSTGITIHTVVVVVLLIIIVIRSI